MGYDIELFHKNDIKEDFNCPICFDILQDPVMISACQHYFCRVCITKWLKDETSCPKCRITTYSVDPPPRILKNLLGELNIKCKKCNSKMKLEAYDNHEKQCKGKRNQQQSSSENKRTSKFHGTKNQKPKTFNNTNNDNNNDNDNDKLNKTELYISGLDPSTTDYGLKMLCNANGLIGVTRTRAFVDKETKRCKGFGFVNFRTETETERALRILRGNKSFHFPVNYARMKNQKQGQSEVGQPLTGLKLNKSINSVSQRHSNYTSSTVFTNSLLIQPNRSFNMPIGGRQSITRQTFQCTNMTSQNGKKPLNRLNNSTNLVPQSYNCYKNSIVTRASLPATQFNPINSPLNNPTVRSLNNSQTFTNQMIQQKSKTKKQNNKQKTSKSDDKTCLIM